MQARNLIVLGIAVILGLFAVYLANVYFSGVEQKQGRVAEAQTQQRIVVANQDLVFGTPLGPQNLRLANWPASSVPAGAFTSISDALRNGRVALRPIVVGEPVLASKVSGADGRATLAANLPTGKLAFAIRIDDVAGVGGFVRPGDVVDILLTRPIPGDGATGSDKMTDVVLEATRVLGIDQVSDESQTTPASGKTATLEVDTFGAQKLALASELGTLSLALRNVTDRVSGSRGTVLPRDLSASNYAIRARPVAAPQAPLVAGPSIALRPRAASFSRPTGPSMTIVRGTQSSDHEVQSGK